MKNTVVHLEEVTVGTALQLGHGLRELRVSSRGVDDLRPGAKETRGG